MVPSEGAGAGAGTTTGAGAGAETFALPFDAFTGAAGAAGAGDAGAGATTGSVAGVVVLDGTSTSEAETGSPLLKIPERVSVLAAIAAVAVPRTPTTVRTVRAGDFILLRYERWSSQTSALRQRKVKDCRFFHTVQFNGRDNRQNGAREGSCR